MQADRIAKARWSPAVGVVDKTFPAAAVTPQFRNRQALPCGFARRDDRIFRGDIGKRIRIRVGALPRINRKAGRPEELDAVGPVGAARSTKFGTTAASGVSGTAFRAMPEMAQTLDLGQILLARRSLPVQRYASRLVDKAIENDFRSWA
jgi:hypothetical protein